MRVISRDTLLAERRDRAEIKESVEYQVHNRQSGKLEAKTLEKRIAHGEMETYVLDSPVGELLTTPAGLDSLVQKSVIDIEQGREQQPLLYQPLYRRRENRGFTKTVQVGTAGTRGHVVFLEHLEGEEVRFGTRTVGAVESIPILTYAAGFQWTEDLEEFDTTWEAEEALRAIGEAYNALLNHLHIYPLISYAYGAGNIQTWNPNALTGTQYEKDRDTLQAALRKASLTVNPTTGRGINPTIMVAHSSNRYRIEDMLQARQIGGTVYQAVGQQITTVILYDGWSDTVGNKTYAYAGVGTGYVLLVEPARYLHELVKHDLITSTDNADLSRLIRAQLVSRSRRGVYAAPASAVMKMNLS
jgi:hypothetical protein